MRLIDIVIMELSKRGGWPENAACVVQDADTQICFSAKTDGLRKPGTDWIGGEWNGPWINFFSNHLAEDHSTSIITREQYEAALAASKPEWDGEGLPPVGCRVEANYGGEWAEVTVAYTERPESHGDAVAWREALVFDCKTTRPFWADEFRPIRSEADKKKEAAIFAIAELCRKSASNGHSAELIYDAIKSEKIVIE